MKETIDIQYSSRKTLAIQIRPDGSLLIRAPLGLPKQEIWAFVEEKREWIEAHRKQMLAAKAEGEQAPLRIGDIQALARQAMADLPPRAERYAKAMGVNYGRITIRNQLSRWGSCSSAGNLNFNCLLMLAPEAVRDYVVVHELAHRKHMDHSAAFWREVEGVMPDYRQNLQWLKTNGPALMARMRSGAMQ